ncbi:MAG TPA: YDG domain-containing protein, partial [Dyella sp.]|uniref:beta strand repeat-containing protein n=1 Tax=Dyella sp. TaxID=1869338 RepID=UPI002CFEB507
FAAITGLNGDTFTLSGEGSMSGKDVNGGTAYTGTGSTTSTTQGFNLGTLGLVGVGSAIAGNYTLVGGTDAYTLTPATLTVVGTTVNTKTYDGTTAATLSHAALSGVLGHDQVTLGNDTSGTFATPNAGTNIGVTAGTMTIGGGDAGDYTLVQPTGLAGTITPVVLDLIGTRVYDGMTDANANLFGTSGVLTGVNGETVDVSGVGVLASKHVGTQSFANLGTLVLSNGTGLASNYTLMGGTDQVIVTPLAITVGASGQGKTYDGNTTAGVTLASNGVLAGDTVNFHDGAANFSSPNAGNNVAITVTGITATGADAGDYSFNNTATTNATINPYVLSLTSTRVYDGTTGADASLFGNNGVISAGVNGETVDLSGAGVLTSKNVGSQRAFANLGSLVLGNGTGLASNYTLAGGTDWVSITPATLTVIDTTTTNRVYDGTTVDALNGATLSGVFGNDNVVLGNDSTGLFGNKNVGNGKAVTTAMTISGGDAGNYILLQPIGLTANVTPLSITVTATGTNRMYNGQSSDVVVLSTNGVLAGDQVSLADGSATFADPYVGNGKTVTVSGITASGTDAGNYVIADPVTTTTANITSAGFDGTGVQGSWIAQLQGGLQPAAIATPYGSSDSDAVGVFTGNQQMKHKPIERNRARSDFRSGLSLQFQNGGVRLPSDASP